MTRVGRGVQARLQATSRPISTPHHLQIGRIQLEVLLQIISSQLTWKAIQLPAITVAQKPPMLHHTPPRTDNLPRLIHGPAGHDKRTPHHSPQDRPLHSEQMRAGPQVESDAGTDVLASLMLH